MRMLKTLPDVVDLGLCTGCGACAYACRDEGVRMVHVVSEGFRPVFVDAASPRLEEALEICRARSMLTARPVRYSDRQRRNLEFGPTLEILGRVGFGVGRPLPWVVGRIADGAVAVLHGGRRIRRCHSLRHGYRPGLG